MSPAKEMKHEDVHRPAQREPNEIRQYETDQEVRDPKVKGYLHAERDRENPQRKTGLSCRTPRSYFEAKYAVP